MYRPSLLQLASAPRPLLVFEIVSAWALPFAGFFLISPVMSLNAMESPLGDQTGKVSKRGSNVNRDGLPLSISTVQISKFRLCESNRMTAALVSLGDRLTAIYRSRVPIVPISLPVLSTQTS